MFIQYPAFLFLILANIAAAAPTMHESSRAIVHELSRELSAAELTEPPRIHLSKAEPSHLIVREGDSATLECSAVGVPAPVIHWRKDGRRVRQVGGDDDANLAEKLANIGSATVESASTIGRLHLDCVQPSMAGLYECVADNGFKKVVNKTKVVVLPRSALIASHYNEDNRCPSLRLENADQPESTAVPPRIVLFTEWRFEKQGNNVQLFCRATGTPRPKITWLNENLEQVHADDNIKVLSNGDLFLRNVQQMGQYYCVASNTAGETRMDTFLYVTRPDDDGETES